MLERQRERIAKARAEGKYKRRRPTVAVHAVQVRELHGAGEKPAHIARRLGIARSSVCRMLDSLTGAPATGRQQPMKVEKDQRGPRSAISGKQTPENLRRRCAS